MSRACFAVGFLLLLTGCHKESKERSMVLIGATTIVAPGAQPIADSVVVIAGAKIRSVGSTKDVTLPQNSDRTDLTGSWIVPAKGSRIAVGETANLIILHHAPNGIEPANPADEGARLVAGEWQVSHK
ncbi:MAG TPA: hypothetical protein VK789_20575 [Bryobacteraceae bacterium]|nr:hypothetical protein [Bryobacteraceae bacterium]